MKDRGSFVILSTVLLVSSIIIVLVEAPREASSYSSDDQGPPSRFAGGYGTINYPFQITNASHFQEMRWFPNDHFIVMNDINATETKNWNGGEGYRPVANEIRSTPGGYSGAFFNGTLNGNGKTVSNLYMNHPYDNYLGVFGYIGLIGKVYDLTLTGIDFGHSGLYIGGMAAINEGTITNCVVGGKVDGHLRVGGMVGINLGLIQNCSTDVDMDASGYAGGFVGENDGTIHRCSSTSSVITQGWWTGGFVGSNNGHIEDCFYNGQVTGNSDGGAFIGKNEGDVQNSFYCVNYTKMNSRKPLSSFGIYKEHYDEWLENDLSIDIDQYLTKVPGTDFYSISSLEDIWNMVPFTYGNIKFRQMEDIDLSPLDDFIIPCFYANEYDGNDHTISNVSVFSPDLGKMGLFGTISKGSRIIDLQADNISLTGDQYIGGIAGVCYGTLINCRVWSSLSGNKYVGGIAGKVEKGSLSGCDSNGFVSGTDSIGGIAGGSYDGRFVDCVTTSQVIGGGQYIGGLIGYLQPMDWKLTGIDVLRCSASGQVTGTAYVGGLAGWFLGNVVMSSSIGQVSGENYVGGLIGTHHDGNISYCYAMGTVSGTGHYAGGLTGRNEEGHIRNCFASGDVTGDQSVGGLSAYSKGGSIENSTAHGDVTGTDSVGGLIGTNSESDVYNCYATGDVEGNRGVGGLIGSNRRCTVKNCYSVGSVIGNDRVGGLIWAYYEDHVVINSFWDTQTSGMSTSYGGIGKTTAQMKDISNFGTAAWDLAKDWGIQDGITTPFLRNLDYSSMVRTEHVLMAYEEFFYEMKYDVTPPFDGLPNYYDWSIETNAGNWLTISEDGFLSGTPRAGDEGRYYVNVKLSHEDVLFTETDFTLSVMNVLDTLKITTAPESVAVEDIQYQVHFNAEDLGPYPRTLQWSLETNSSFLAIYPLTGLLIGTPDNDDVGTHWVKVTVSDGTERKTSLNYTLTVVNVNDDPIIVIDELPPAYEDIPYWVNVKTIDVDPTNDVLSWSMVTNGHFLDLDPSTGNLSTTSREGDSGDYWVLINVEDGRGGNTSKNLTLSVIGVNDPPHLNITSFIFEGYEDIDLLIPMNDVFHDTENDPLQFSHNYSGELVVVISHGVARIVSPLNWNGQDNITLTAHDGTAGTPVTITVIFNPVNDAPHDVTLIARSRFVNEELQLLECTANDHDIIYGDSLHYLWTSNISGEIGTNKTLWVSLPAGIHLITLTVTDEGGLFANATAEIEVIFDDYVAHERESSKAWIIILTAVIIAIIVISAMIYLFLFFLKRSKGKEEEEKEPEEDIELELKEKKLERELEMFEELTHRFEEQPKQPATIAQGPMPLPPQPGAYPGYPPQPIQQASFPQQQIYPPQPFAPPPTQPMQPPQQFQYTQQPLNAAPQYPPQPVQQATQQYDELRSQPLQQYPQAQQPIPQPSLNGPFGYSEEIPPVENLVKENLQHDDETDQII